MADRKTIREIELEHRDRRQLVLIIGWSSWVADAALFVAALTVSPWFWAVIPFSICAFAALHTWLNTPYRSAMHERETWKPEA